MKKKPANVHESQAKAKLAVARLKIGEMIDVTRKTASGIKANPSYSNQPELQGAVATWLTLADALENGSHVIHARRASMLALTAGLAVALGVWKRATDKVVANVNQAAGGSAEAVAKWGFEVATRTPSAPAADAPAKLRAHITKERTLVLDWQGVRGQRGYLLQIGDGTPAGWGPTIHLAAPRYVPQGLPVGQHASARVAVQRKSGVSDWSDAISFVAR